MVSSIAECNTRHRFQASSHLDKKKRSEYKKAPETSSPQIMITEDQMANKKSQRAPVKKDATS